MAKINWTKNLAFLNVSTVKTAGVNRSDWIGFLDAIGRVEGNNNYQTVNSLGYVGIYQFASMSNPGSIFVTLDFKNNLGKMLGVSTNQDFLKNPLAQELAAIMEFSGIPDVTVNFTSKFTAVRNAYTAATKYQFDALVNQTFTLNYFSGSNANVVASQTITLSKAGISAAAHLVGEGVVAAALKDIYSQAFANDIGIDPTPTIYFDINGNYADGNNISFATYIQLFGSYDISALTNTEDGANFIQFNQLVEQLLGYRREKIVNYLTNGANDIPMSIQVGNVSYKETIRAILSALGLEDQYLDSVQGNVILTGGKTTNFTSKSDLVFGLNSLSGNTLSGDAGSDTLIGGQGNDLLDGGKGNDTLIGGDGFDTYIWHAGDHDTIIDSDGKGIIKFVNADGTVTEIALTGAFVSANQAGNNYHYILPNGDVAILSHNSPWKITMPDGSVLELGEDFEDGDYGIHLVDAEVENPTPALTLVGDIEAYDRDPEKPDTQFVYDELGNVSVTGEPEEGREDKLYGGDGNDSIAGKGGDDILIGQSGDDTVIGGEGSDIALGLSGNDILFASEKTLLIDALQAMNIQEPSGIRGDFLDGGAGDDTLIGDAGHDALVGGAGDDLILAGAGDDNIDGDLTFTSISRDWAVDRWISNGVYHMSFSNAYFNVASNAEYGNDVIYAGEGNDWVLGGKGDDFVDGGDGNDVLWGEHGSDTLIGGNGDDILNGGNNLALPTEEDLEDFILGGDGNDSIAGQGGDDVLYGEDGNDTIGAGLGNDYVNGGAGQDSLVGDEGNDTIEAGNGDDELGGLDGDDLLLGDDGNDLLEGGDGNDTLIGGKGDDQLYGGNGDDTYTLGADDGNDTIFDEAGHNTLVFEDGITLADLSLNYQRSSQALSLTYKENKVTIYSGQDANGYAAQALSGNGLSLYKFSDGTELTHTELIDLLLPQVDYEGGDANDTVISGGHDDFISGGAGNDRLISQSGADTLDGGAGNDSIDGGAGDDLLSGYDGDDEIFGGQGNDTLLGGQGSDTYHFNIGDGQDLIIEAVSNVGVDILSFGEGILSAGLNYYRLDNGDLKITMNGTDDAVTIQGWFNSTSLPIEQIIFADGTELSGSALSNITLSAIEGTDTDDLLIGTHYQDTLVGGLGNDTLIGGTGNDALIGGGGDDAYVFGYGAGKDTVVDISGNNIINLQNTAVTSLTFTQQGGDLLIGLLGGSDSLTIIDYFEADAPAWTVNDGNGVSRLLPDLIASVEEDDQYSALRDDFFAAAQNQLVSAYLNAGYVLNAAGDYVKSWSSGDLSVSRYNQTQTILSYWANIAGSPISSPSETITVSYSSLSTPYLVNQAGRINQTSIEVAGQNYEDTSVSSYLITTQQSVYANILWNNNYSRTTSHYVSSSYVHIDVPENPMTGQPAYVSTMVFVQDTTLVGGTQYGTITSINQTESDNPSYISGVLTTYDTTISLKEIQGNALNNAIQTYNSYAVVNGADGDDTISGAGGIFYGGQGDDSLNSAKYLYGGDGNDTLAYGTYQYGDDGDDFIQYGTYAYGGSGNDTLSGGSYLYGEEGDDFVSGGSLLHGGIGNDTLIGYLYTDAMLDGAEGNDYLYGQGTLIGGTGSDTFEGGDGIVHYVLTSDPGTTDVIIDKGSNTSAYEWWFYENYKQEVFDTEKLYSFHSNPDINTHGKYIFTESELRHFLATEQSWLTFDRALAEGYVSLKRQYVSPEHALLDADDYESLKPFYLNGVIPLDVVEMPDGVNPDDITYAWGQIEVTSPVTLTTVTYKTIDISWGGGNQQVRLAVPDASDSLGAGVEQLKFQDGSIIWVGDLIAQLPVSVIASNGADVLTGTESDELIDGLKGRDLLNGLGGNDSLLGSEGNDTLAGGKGDDFLVGASGNDTYLFNLGDGQDVIDNQGVTTDTDRLIFGEGIYASQIQAFREADSLVLVIKGTSDKLTFNQWFMGAQSQINRIEFHDGVVWDSEALFIFAEQAIQVVLGTDENDWLTVAGNGGALNGLAGDDYLSGSGGDDTLEGGLGNDTLYGHAGNDVYIFSRGDGPDVLVNFGGEEDYDVLRLGAGISPEDILISRPDDGSSDLLIQFKETNDSVRIVGWYGYIGDQIQAIEFANGIVWNATKLDQLARSAPILGTTEADTLIIWSESGGALNGLAGDDYLLGSGGDDTLEGSLGNDTLYGHEGNDVYIFSRGDGQDVIANFGDEEDYDVLELGADIAPDDIILERVDSSDLLIRIKNTEDSIRVVSWYGSLGDQLQAIKFADGTIWDGEVLAAHIRRIPEFGTADMDYMYANELGGALNGLEGDDVLEGSLGNDTLIGGLGADTLIGGLGDDVYVFNLGDGQDVIDNYGTDVDFDQILFGAGISPDEIEFFIEDSDSLTIKINSSGDSIRILSWFSSADSAIQEFKFYDGTVWNYQAIQNKVLLDTTPTYVSGTAGNDSIEGTSKNDWINADNGNDYVVGGAGNDTIIADDGDDSLYGGDGQDSISGDGYLSGDAGNDSITGAGYLTGGAGDDFVYGAGNLNGDAGNDVMVGTGLLSGGDGEDLITGIGTGDNLNGNAGNDTINGQGYISGGEGADSINGSGSVFGDAGDDTISGGQYGVIFGGAGNDIITATGTATLFGDDGNDVIYASAYGNVLVTGNGLDIVYGGNGADTIAASGSSGDKLLYGGLGNDNIYGGNANDIAYGDAGNDVLMGDAGNDILHGGDGQDTIGGGNGNDYLNGGYGNDTMYDYSGNDTLVSGMGHGYDVIDVQHSTSAEVKTLILEGLNPSDIGLERWGTSLGIGYTKGGVWEGLSINNYFASANNRVDIIQFADGTVWDYNAVMSQTIRLSGTASSEVLLGFTNTPNDIYSKEGNDLIKGGNLIDGLRGDAGNDIMQALDGDDVFFDGAGNNVLDGGIGTDTFNLGSGNDLIIGGKGYDFITTGTGYDIIAFNRGDGSDVINASTGADNTLSLGGNISYDSLVFSQSGNDLVLGLGYGDQITFSDWYADTANQSILNLQVIAEAMANFDANGTDTLLDDNIETFNFASLVTAFDSARAANSSLTTWQLSNALLDFHLGGSDTAAIGGDLAYQYGLNGNLTGIGLNAAQSVINASSFGQSAQTLNSPSSWQTETIKLS